MEPVLRKAENSLTRKGRSKLQTWGGIENSALPTFSYDGVYADRTVEDITAKYMDKEIKTYHMAWSERQS